MSLDSMVYEVEAFREEMEDYVDEMESRKGLSLSTAEDVLKYVEEHGVSSIRIWFTDMLGFVKSFSITPKELKGAFEEGMGFDGSSITGFRKIQESDMMAWPDASTAQVLPFRPGGSRAIRMFAEIRTPDGTPYIADPRVILSKNLGRLEGLGFSHMNVGPEAEYFYFQDETSTGLLDNAGYFDVNPADAGDDLREATVFAMEAMGIVLEYHHAEVGPSQHEIDIRYQEALRMADQLQTYKYLVKECARRCGVFATFMPKPIAGENGSGMHTHLSIFKDGSTNAFYDKDGDHHLSDTARHFIAGVLEHSRDMALITNQWYNSYQRLVPGYEAPVFIAWAMRNRSAAIRIPLYKPGNELATRMEIRFPDPACNPYLTFSVMLSAGLDGLAKKTVPPDPVTVDLYDLSSDEVEDLGIASLPQDLAEAVDVAVQSDFLKEALGAHVHESLIENKSGEVDKFRLHVSEFDLEEHLKL